MHKRKVLFICSHNSARSQMAQGWLNHLAGDRFEAESAGFEAGTIKSAAVEAMAEVGIDIAHHTAKASLDLFGQGRHFGYIINVCDKESTLCPPIWANGGMASPKQPPRTNGGGSIGTPPRKKRFHDR